MSQINDHGIKAVLPFAVRGVDYQLIDHSDGNGVQIQWLCDQAAVPAYDLAEIMAASDAWQAEQDALAYRDKRAAEYPPLQDFVDAQVKKASADADVRAAGEAQEAAYIAACLAVKAKYPKGGV